MYATNPHIEELGSIEDWAGVFPLFHWSFIPWAFYLVLAVAFAFMLHVRKRNRQRYSEACRPVIGNHADGVLGRVIDLFALFALLAGTATTFSVATPLMAGIIVQLFHIEISNAPLNSTNKSLPSRRTFWFNPAIQPSKPTSTMNILKAFISSYAFSGNRPTVTRLTL